MKRNLYPMSRVHPKRHFIVCGESLGAYEPNIMAAKASIKIYSGEPFAAAPASNKPKSQRCKLCLYKLTAAQFMHRQPFLCRFHSGNENEGEICKCVRVDLETDLWP